MFASRRRHCTRTLTSIFQKSKTSTIFFPPKGGRKSRTHVPKLKYILTLVRVEPEKTNSSEKIVQHVASLSAEILCANRGSSQYFARNSLKSLLIK